MKDWELEEAQRRLDEVVRRAKRCGPQRITGADGAAVVLGAADYRRLLLESGVSEDDLGEGCAAPAGERLSFLEFMQRSPLAEAMRAGEISPEEWDRVCRIGR